MDVYIFFSFTKIDVYQQFVPYKVTIDGWTSYSAGGLSQTDAYPLAENGRGAHSGRLGSSTENLFEIRCIFFLIFLVEHRIGRV